MIDLNRFKADDHNYDVQEYRTPTENSDFHQALGASGVVVNFSGIDVKHLYACIPGHNDEDGWYWVVELKDGRFGLLWAWCDYTGWGCQDGGKWIGAKDLNDIQRVLDEVHIGDKKDTGLWGEFESRKIKEQLIKQITGGQPYGLEIENIT